MLNGPRNKDRAFTISSKAKFTQIMRNIEFRGDFKNTSPLICRFKVVFLF